MSKPALIYAALHEKVGAELLNETVKENQLRFMLRVKLGQSTTTWLATIDHLIMLGDRQLATGKPEWTIDVSKQYFRKPDLKYGWRIIIQEAELSKYYDMLAREIRSVQVQGYQIEEVKLHGSPNRSKTAGLLGHVPIGPMALHTR